MTELLENAILGITTKELLKEVPRIISLTQPVFLSNIPELRDRQDKIVLEAAVSASVDVIVSGDEDLGDF
ncbi:MAG: PIN domain-containing protein [Waterburya sp.]